MLRVSGGASRPLRSHDCAHWLTFSLLAVSACSGGSEGRDVSDASTLDASSEDAALSTPPEDGILPLVSGSRLQLLKPVFQDAPVTNRFYDTQLQVNCSFERVNPTNEPTPVYRCVPHTVDYSEYEIPYFSDSACTKPAIAVLTNCATQGTRDGYFALMASGTCARRSTARLGNKLSAVVYQKSATGCAMATPGASRELYEANVVDLETLVAATERVLTVPSATQLEAVYLEASDGARALLEMRVLGVRAESDQDADGKLRLFPGAASTVGHYANSTCQEPAVALTESTCVPLWRFVKHTEWDVVSGCGRRVALHERGERLEGPLHYREPSNPAATCIAFSPTGTHGYALGREQDTSVFPLIETRELGNDRIKLRMHFITGFPYPVTFGGGYVDSKWNTSCQPERQSDGTTRCIPSFGPSSQRDYYASATCGKALILPDCYETATPFYTEHYGPATCGRSETKIYQTTTREFSGEAYYKDYSTAECVPYNIGKRQVLELGSLVSPASFAEVPK